MKSSCLLTLLKEISIANSTTTTLTVMGDEIPTTVIGVELWQEHPNGANGFDNDSLSHYIDGGDRDNTHSGSHFLLRNSGISSLLDLLLHAHMHLIRSGTMLVQKLNKLTFLDLSHNPLLLLQLGRAQ